LQGVERRTAVLIESDHLAVDDGVVGQFREALDDAWISDAEIIVVA
jgi:hypothetical protein